MCFDAHHVRFPTLFGGLCFSNVGVAAPKFCCSCGRTVATGDRDFATGSGRSMRGDGPCSRDACLLWRWVSSDSACIVNRCDTLERPRIRSLSRSLLARPRSERSRPDTDTNWASYAFVLMSKTSVGACFGLLRPLRWIIWTSGLGTVRIQSSSAGRIQLFFETNSRLAVPGEPAFGFVRFFARWAACCFRWAACRASSSFSFFL